MTDLPNRGNKNNPTDLLVLYNSCFVGLMSELPLMGERGGGNKDASLFCSPLSLEKIGGSLGEARVPSRPQYVTQPKIPKKKLESRSADGPFRGSRSLKSPPR